MPTRGRANGPHAFKERRTAERDPSCETEPAPAKGRRLRDQLEEEGDLYVPAPALHACAELRNPLLLCDDDLRQTARALSDIEDFVLQSMKALGRDDVTREELLGLLRKDLSTQLDTLADSLSGLRKSLLLIAQKVD